MAEQLFTYRKIQDFSYFPEKKVLKIMFHHGTTYFYGDVPNDLYAAMKRSKDPSRFFDKKVYAHFTVLDQRHLSDARRIRPVLVKW